MPFTATKMDPEITILSEISQIKKDKYHITFLWNLIDIHLWGEVAKGTSSVPCGSTCPKWHIQGTRWMSCIPDVMQRGGPNISAAFSPHPVSSRKSHLPNPNWGIPYNSPDHRSSIPSAKVLEKEERFKCPRMWEESEGIQGLHPLGDLDGMLGQKRDISEDSDDIWAECGVQATRMSWGWHFSFDRCAW